MALFTSPFWTSVKFVASLAVQLVLEVAVHAVLAARAPREARTPRDEREQLIEMRATRLAFHVLLIGALAGVATIHVSRSAWVMQQVVLFAVVLLSEGAELLESMDAEETRAGLAAAGENAGGEDAGARSFGIVGVGRRGGFLAQTGDAHGGVVVVDNAALGRLADQAFEGGPGHFGEFVREDNARYGKLVREAGIKLE